MTSLAVALSADSRGPSGLYVITDSRITLGVAGRWDTGQKTFASGRTPDIFGFAGDAFFPPAMLRQLLDQVNCGLLFDGGIDAERRHSLLAPMLRRAVAQHTGVPKVSTFAVFHGARDGEFMNSRFRLWETRYSGSSKPSWTDDERDLDTNANHSYLALVEGTGAEYIRKRGEQGINTDAKSTTRAAIWSFCNALREGQDPFSGGAPQLVGIWRKGPAQTFGFRWGGKSYLSGSVVPRGADFARVHWFNHRFERRDGENGRLLGRRHNKPKLIPIERVSYSNLS
jgi:hypothetical protein